MVPRHLLRPPPRGQYLPLPTATPYLHRYSVTLLVCKFATMQLCRTVSPFTIGSGEDLGIRRSDAVVPCGRHGWRWELYARKVSKRLGFATRGACTPT